MDQSDATMAHRNAQAASAFKLGRMGRGLTNGSSCGQEESFMELDLLLPNWQLMELEKAASHLGLTTGQLLRRLIRSWLARLDRHPFPGRARLPERADAERRNVGFVSGHRDGQRLA